MPKYTRQLLLLAKKETVYGTDPVPTAAVNAMLVSNAKLTPLDGDEVKHEYQRPYFGNSGAALVTRRATLSFETEMSGSGAAGTAPGYAVLFEGCAASVTVAAGVSVTVAPITSGQSALTLHCNIDGINHVLTGARGEVKLRADAKTLPKWTWEFTGLWSSPSTVTQAAPTYTAFVDAVGVNKINTSLTLHGVSLVASGFGLEAGNRVVKRDLIGGESVLITDRASTAKLVCEAVPLATKDWVTAGANSASGALQLVHGTVAGNIVTISAPAAQIGKPGYSDQDGIVMVDLPLSLNPSASGNNEWSIVFT